MTTLRKKYYIYILTNYLNTVLYIGVTDNLKRRIYEHKNKLIEGFTQRYNISKLVYFEEYKYIADALRREKQLKNWHRDWKWNLVKSKNPKLLDLTATW